MASSRKAVEEKVYKTLDLMDPSGQNSAKYKAMFKDMSDNQFFAFFKSMANDENHNFYVEMSLFGKSKLLLPNIEKAADFLKVPLEEYIYIRHKTEDGRAVRSKYRVPVLFIHLKRMQQIISKKNHFHTEITGPGVRSKLTGALTSSSRTGRMSDMDTLALLSVSMQDSGIGGESPILQEILGARADNMSKKLFMQNSISMFGSTRLADYPGELIKESQAVNTFDVFLISAGLKSDIVTRGLETRQVMT